MDLCKDADPDILLKQAKAEYLVTLPSTFLRSAKTSGW